VTDTPSGSGARRPTFVTPHRVTIPGVTAAEMREVDRIAIEQTGPALLQMMEHAGRSLAELVLESIAGAPSHAAVVVLAGAGGNGGGGICAARHLAGRVADVALCLAAPDRLTEAARAQRNTFQYSQGREITPVELVDANPDVIVDALVGYGLSSAPRGTVAALIEWARARSCTIVSLDVPSGIDATTGTAPGLAILPTATVTLALPKTGLSREVAGRLFLADLGIPATAYRRAGITVVRPFCGSFVVPITRI